VSSTCVDPVSHRFSAARQSNWVQFRLRISTSPFQESSSAERKENLPYRVHEFSLSSLSSFLLNPFRISFLLVIFSSLLLRATFFLKSFNYFIWKVFATCRVVCIEEPFNRVLWPFQAVVKNTYASEKPELLIVHFFEGISIDRGRHTIDFPPTVPSCRTAQRIY